MRNFIARSMIESTPPVLTHFLSSALQASLAHTHTHTHGKNSQPVGAEEKGEKPRLQPLKPQSSITHLAHFDPDLSLRSGL